MRHAAYLSIEENLAPKLAQMDYYTFYQIRHDNSKKIIGSLRISTIQKRETKNFFFLGVMRAQSGCFMTMVKSSVSVMTTAVSLFGISKNRKNRKLVRGWKR